MGNAEALYKSIQVGPLKCNMSIIGDVKTKEAVLVDPGGDASQIKDLIDSMGVKIVQILITHGHWDHFLAAAQIKALTGAPILLHKDDLESWRNMPNHIEKYGMHEFAKFVRPLHKDPDQWLEEGQKLQVLDGVTIHTPGHSPGSCCFYFKKLKLLCSGDTLFRMSVGKTDGQANMELLKKSVKEKLYLLPDDTRVVPGHGQPTILGIEKMANPFVRAYGREPATTKASKLILD